nr:hypothetical protein [Klebsiella pneumoniae]
MSKYSDLLQVIKSRVCQNNNFPQTLLADSHSYRARQVWYRIGQIFTLECILDEYRKHFSSDYYYLDNDKALHHLIFEMTKWKPEEIRRCYQRCKTDPPQRLKIDPGVNLLL